MTAHEIASTPELYNEVYSIKGNEWECMGYTKSGTTIKFSRIVTLATNKLLVRNIYLKPQTEINEKQN